jgi:hypothetical protein
MAEKDGVPRTDRPAGGRDLPLPGIKTAQDMQRDRESYLEADVDLETNELHAAGRTCARCGLPIGPHDDARRTAGGAYEHEVCRTR